MFRVTADVFSGRPNPTWIVENPDVSRDILSTIVRERDNIRDSNLELQGLGYRGLQIDLLSEEDSSDYELPPSFVIGTRAGQNSRDIELAAQVIETMTKYSSSFMPDHTATPITPEMQEIVLNALRAFALKPLQLLTPVEVHLSTTIRVTVSDDACRDCQIEVSRFNPGFWNNNPNVRYNNNCYNYARNWKTNTFAQPGRAHRCYPYDMACEKVENAALCDGLHKRCDCLPDSEYPRRFMALVVWPGVDYHWYRKQMEGFWGHKPGGTHAKNTDNSGNIILDPETADRGGYTDFCGYFYAGKSVVIS